MFIENHDKTSLLLKRRRGNSRKLGQNIIIFWKEGQLLIRIRTKHHYVEKEEDKLTKIRTKHHNFLRKRKIN